jgi:putative ABC transport system ATP-binding protein
MTGASPVLSATELRFAWPGSATRLIDVPHFAMAASEAVFLSGPSGAGKSSLLALMAGVLPASHGAVCLLGQDWRTMSASRRDARRADHVGVIFQQFNLLPYLSVLDNVLLPCRFSRRRATRSLEGFSSAAEAARHLLDRLGLDASLHHRPAVALSVGQQQRVAAARALIGRPDLIVADEPTSALDEPLRQSFMRLLLQACQDSGSALLFVSHDARLAEHFTRRVDLRELQRAGPASSAAAA